MKTAARKTAKPAAKKAAKSAPKSEKAKEKIEIALATVKADGFETTRGDLRPHGPAQVYPYSLVNRWRGDKLEVSKGDKVVRGTPLSQGSPKLQTLFQVEGGETKATARPGMISFDGEVSIEDFFRWRNDGLTITGVSADFTGREPYMRVIASQIQNA